MDEQDHNTPTKPYAPQAPAAPTQPTGFKKHLRSVWEVIEFAVIALLIVIPIRMFVAQPFVVSGTSMVPTFHNGDYLIVDQISYRFEDPKRGDVIIFKYPKDPTKYFIKRIIGLPGDTVSITGTVVTIYNDEHPEGLSLVEPYVTNTISGTTRTVVTPGHYFVMGDNRPASSDSRFWGLLPENFITGRALVQLLPVSDIALFPGEHIFTE